MLKLKMKILLSFLVIGFSSANKVTRIAGGDSISIEEYPFSVSLLSSRGSGQYQHTCGGTILSNTAILSAASCFHTEDALDPASWWRARVGSTFSDAGGIVHTISTITPHPGFSTGSLDNDIAVLKTTWPMAYGPGVQPASIAGGAFLLEQFDEVWGIGWGATQSSQLSASSLQHVQVWVVDQQTCSNRYQELGFSVTSNMVCAGWLDVGIRGQCQGDAGSPLLRNGAVVGVFSWAEGCAQGWYPGISTRVSPYSWWIFSLV